MEIRSYKEKDFQEIVDVIQATQITDCWPKVYPEGWNESRINFEFDPIKDYHNPLFLVSEQEGIITGLIAGHGLGDFITYEVKHLSDEFNRQIKLGEIPYYQRDLIIHPNFQRVFTGLRLFKDMKKFAKEKEYNILITRTPPENTKGIKFFKRLGYQEIFRDSNPKRIYFKIPIR